MLNKEQALQVAVSQIGQQEKPIGSNWGHPVEDYLNSVGIEFPASWCMAFMYWCFNQTGQLNPLFKTGGVLRQLQERKDNVITDSPQPGDIFILDFGHGLGHTGIVEFFDPNKKLIHTIEGNTNDTGSREGYEVCRRVRNSSDVKAFIRF